MARNSNTIVVLDIGGTVFKTETLTLKTIPNSLLANLNEASEWYDTTKNLYYFDRDPHCFKQILNAYRQGELHITRDVCPQQFRHELEFWRIPIKLLSPCCWKAFYKTDYDLDVISTLLKRVGHCMYGTMTAEQPPKALLTCQVSKDTNSNTTEQTQCNTKARRISALVHHEVEEHFKLKRPKNRMDGLWLLLEEPRSSLAAKVNLTCFFF